MTDKVIAIQIGAVSFQDEGVGAVLDTVAGRAEVNTLFLASATWNRATGGKAELGRPFPDHGTAEHDPDWRGGNYARMRPEYYSGTALGAAGRAEDYPNWDIFDAVLPKAEARGMKSYALIDESSHARQLRRYPGFLRCLEVDIWNKPARRPCFSNPDYRNWHLGLIEDYINSYPLDGLTWSSARPSPMDRLMQEPTLQGQGRAVCYCAFCKARAVDRGIDWRRAQEGYRKLVSWNAQVAAGDLPGEGAFVVFWRLLMTYPEILAWQGLWIDGQHQMYRDIFGTVKAFRPDMKVGWSIYHNWSFSPFYRAGQAFQDLSHICDFLVIPTWDGAAGPRFHTWVRNICKALFADASPAEVYPVLLKLLGLDEAPLGELAGMGFSADSIRRQTETAITSAEGRCKIYAGIDIDIPVGRPADHPGPHPDRGDLAEIEADDCEGPDLVRTTPERVGAAVKAAFQGGAHGVLLGRKYSEMNLDNLSGVSAALSGAGR